MSVNDKDLLKFRGDINTRDLSHTDPQFFMLGNDPFKMIIASPNELNRVQHRQSLNKYHKCINFFVI